MKIKKQLQIATFLILSLAAVSTACSDEKSPEMKLVPEELTSGPGLTAEMQIEISFTDTSTGDTSIVPGKAGLKRFAEEPVISSSNPDVKLLSVDTNRSKTGINAEIILGASDELLSGSSSIITAAWGGLETSAVLKIKKNPDDYIDSDGVVTDPAAYDVLINKERRLPADYIPPDLVRVEVPTILSFEEVNHLRRAASDALSAMFAAAEAEQGYELLARSGYRSYKTQVMLYDLNVREYGEDYAKRISAKPGTSEHQSGLTMDISSPVVNYQLTEDFGETDEGRWVAANAHRFGFILRYLKGKEAVTGYTYEPWHIRYVGPELAAEVYGSGLTFEEYFNY